MECDKSSGGPLPFCPACAVFSAPSSTPRIHPARQCELTPLCFCASIGSAGAMFELGYRFTAGLGVMQDSAQAADWYRAGAYGGDLAAMVRWAFCLEKGLGVTRNRTEARYWYDKAARQGHRYAARRLQAL